MKHSLQKIIEGVSNFTGENFLNHITQQLSDVIQADYTFIARLDTDKYVSITMALVAKGTLVDNFEYSLEHTPCANVADNNICSYPNNVCSLFPKDQLLVDMNVEGYIGTPLLDSKGKVMGIIVALYEDPIANKEETISLFNLFSGRIASEMVNMEYERELKALNQNLELTIKKRTQELEKAHHRLVESEKLAALGSLVAGVAHEVNTPLGVSITASSQMSDSLNVFADKFSQQNLDTDEVQYFIEQSKTVCKLLDSNLSRAKDLIDNFKQTAADQSHVELEEINIKNYYYKITSTLTPLLKSKKINLSIEIDDSFHVVTFPGAHAQILTNLISNSVNHGFDNMESNIINITIHKKKNTFIVRYFDNGKGIAVAEQKKIFEPFYTTARNDGNTGLGLSIVHNLSQQLGGEVAFIPDDNGFCIEYKFSDFRDES